MSSRILSSFLRKANPFIARITRVQKRTVKTAPETEVNDAPIKYSTSKAGQWKAAYSTSGKEYFSSPRSESTFIVMSITAILVYFCILREENDLDDWLRQIETEVPLKLEEGQLRGQIEHGKRNKLDVSAYEKRLEFIQKIQEKVKVSSGH